MRRKLMLAVRAVLQSVVGLLPVTSSVAQRYARIKAELALRGTPIPVNDIWIAATALEEDLVLVTHDTHFERVPGLTLENWLR